MKHIFLIILLASILTSCQQKQKDNVAYDLASLDGDIVPITRMSQNAANLSIDVIEKSKLINKKKIIKDGSLTIEVFDLEKTKDHIDSLVYSHDGYYSNENFYNEDSHTFYSLDIKLPTEKFEMFIIQIENGNGEILSKNIEARDVTDQFIDLETRLENKRNYLAKYNDLLNKAKTVKDIIEIKENIRKIEEEMQSTTGRLKYLNYQVDYSKISLSIFKAKKFKYEPIGRDKFSESLKKSLSKGWFGFVDFLLFLIKIWPFWIIATGILIAWKKYKKIKK